MYLGETALGSKHKHGTLITIGRCTIPPRRLVSKPISVHGQAVGPANAATCITEAGRRKISGRRWLGLEGGGLGLEGGGIGPEGGGLG